MGAGGQKVQLLCVFIYSHRLTLFVRLQNYGNLSEMLH
jgi:hypothetical protein